MQEFTEYIIEISKYLIIILMLLYAYESFSVFRFAEESRRRGIYIRQTLLLFLIQFFCFFSLYLKSKKIEYLFFYAFVQIFLFSCMILTRMIYEKANRLLLNHMCLLLGTGFVILSRMSLNRAVKQFVIVAVSYVICLLIPYLMNKITSLPKIGWAYALAGLTALSAVLVAGEVTHGSKISFSLAGVTFQPSEFVKILFVFLLAAMLCQETSFKRICLTALAAGAHVILLVVSKDLGSALIFFAAFVFVVFLATGNYWYLLAGLAGGAGASAVAYQLFDHVRIRVQAWQDPWVYIDTKGYQITQSLFAIGSGNWIGMGLYGGTPGDIPYVEADFIFSAVCEEMGVIFGMCLILVCVSCFVMIMQIAVRAKDRFYQLIAYGIGIIYIFQIFLTVGGGIKFIPLTGVTLPFVSYGGSSVLTTMVLFFVMQGIVTGKGNMSGKKVKFHANRSAAAVTYGFILLFTAMLIYLGYFTASSQQEMINNSYNSRQEILLSENYRGIIYSGDGQVLAETVLDADGGETRVYPFENLFAHVIGYSTRGKTGVEAQANYYLINSDLPLPEKVANQVAGQKNPGNSVYTSLDVELQQIASTYMANYDGAIIVTEPSTGRILAMVSKPDFDPNRINEIWDDLVADEGNSVLLNRATQGLYPPGSTFKIFTALEYIREHPEDYMDYSYSCNGTYKKGDQKIQCYHGISHGAVDFYKSFAKSCNSSFANIGMSLDKERFGKTLDGLLFNQELPVAFRYSKSVIVMDDTLGDNAMMQSSIGQWKTQMTPLHLNMVTAAIANHGVMMKPYVIDRVETSAGGKVRSFGSAAYKTVMTEEETAILTEMMVQVVEKGTGDVLKGLEYTAAGKTGSAEYNNIKGDSHAWFTGFAPVEDPRICVTVIIEGAGSGGDYAVPIAKRIFDAYLLRGDE